MMMMMKAQQTPKAMNPATRAMQGRNIKAEVGPGAAV